MKALRYEAFGERPEICAVREPVAGPDDVVLRVTATGICRSDWHGWMGHDPDIRLPHVPGHEIAGVVESRGGNIRRWQVGDRVTLPFVCGCGQCRPCRSGNQQVCDAQFQPGFTHWGSFAERVRICYAEANLVALPARIDDVTAASLGCRFATSWRAVVSQGRVEAGEWVAVHGCGGVGLSAVMIAHALGARVIAIDINEAALHLATRCGAEVLIHAGRSTDVAGVARRASSGGVQLSIDALGSPATCGNSINSLGKRGRHVQVGLMVEQHGQVAVPMGRVIADELELLGSHGIQAHAYGPMLALIESGVLQPGLLVEQTIALDDAADYLCAMGQNHAAGITVINRF